MKITVLNDNRKDCDEFECEHGLSLLIEHNGKKILFDAGQTNIFIKNAEKLGVNLSDVDFVVLSHGDYDHGNGLKYWETKSKIDLFAHTDIFKNRISKRTGNYDGLNQNRKEFENKFNLVLTKTPMEMSKDIIFLGEIKRYEGLHIGGLPMVDENNKNYKHLDDSGFVISTPQGLVVFSGCAHSGICNTVQYAKEITGQDKVFAVIGGFHLKEIDEQATETLDYFNENGVEHIFLAHCTSDEVCEYFTENLPEKTIVMKTGMSYSLPQENIEVEDCCE